MAGRHLNVLKSPLALFSTSPPTGFYRDGFCRVGPDDTGNHSVAVTLTDSFLDFSAARGNHLRAAGLTAGCKWCVCAARWREALEFSRAAGGGGEGGSVNGGGGRGSGGGKVNGGYGTDLVPRVVLEATHEKALDVVGLEDLRRFARNAKAQDEVVGVS